MYAGVPAGHTRQCVEPSGLLVPGGQASQTMSPVAEPGLASRCVLLQPATIRRQRGSLSAPVNSNVPLQGRHTRSDVGDGAACSYVPGVHVAVGKQTRFDSMLGALSWYLGRDTTKPAVRCFP